jgi:hypothetical protein
MEVTLDRAEQSGRITVSQWQTGVPGLRPWEASAVRLRAALLSTRRKR